MMSEDFDVKVKEEPEEVGELERENLHQNCNNLVDFVPPPFYKVGQPSCSAAALRRRRARQKETPEQKRARLDRNNERLKLKRQKEAQEEPNEETLRKKRRNLELLRKRRALQKETKTPEQKRAKQDKINHRLKLKRSREFLADKDKDKTDAQLAEEVKLMLLEKRDKWGHNVTWTETQDGRLIMTRNELNRVKFKYQNFIQSKRREEKVSEEERIRRRELQNFKNLTRSAHMTEEERERKRLENYLAKHAYQANMSKEKREKLLERQRAKSKHYYHNMTEEQRAKLRVAQLRAGKKFQEKHKERLRQYYKDKRVSETPEQRQKALQYFRINQAKRQLKTKLEKAGVPPETIQEQVDQLVTKMKSEPLPPLDQLSEYKPRPRKNQRQEMRRREAPGTTAEDRDQRQKGTPARPQIATTSSEDQQYPPPSLSQSVSLAFVEVEDHNSTNFYDGNDMEDYYDHSETPQSPDINSICDALLPPVLSPGSKIIDDNDDTKLNFTDCELAPPSPISVVVIKTDGSDMQLPSLAIPSPTPPPKSIPSAYPHCPDTNKCPHCPSSFPEVTQLHLHINSTHPEKCWKCPKCSTVLVSPEDLKQHFKSEHPKPEVKRNESTKKSSETTRKPKQTKKPLKIFRFVCMKCPTLSPRSQFETVNKLLKHVKTAHPKAFWPCPRCNLLKYNSTSLKIHSRICKKNLRSS